jgi:anti-sigma-K factor RskA
VSHLEHDRLVLLALGDEAVDQREAEHVTDCPSCRVQLEDLRVVATLSGETQEVRDLPPAPERVWRAIEAAVAPAEHGVEPRRRRRRSWRTVALVLAAAVVAVAATIGVSAFLDRGSSPAVAARARLDRLALAPAGAHGDAEILDTGGQPRLRLHVSGMPLQPGFFEVWLLDPDSGGMIALGAMGTGADALLPLPPRVDLRVYRMIDVSAEDYDGNPAHSGRSMLRGSLTK